MKIRTAFERRVGERFPILRGRLLKVDKAVSTTADTTVSNP